MMDAISLLIMYEANVLFWTPSVVSGARAAEHITTGSIRVLRGFSKSTH